jgi:hypothetical protein
MPGAARVRIWTLAEGSDVSERRCKQGRGICLSLNPRPAWSWERKEGMMKIYERPTLTAAGSFTRMTNALLKGKKDLLSRGDPI